MDCLGVAYASHVLHNPKSPLFPSERGKRPRMIPNTPLTLDQPKRKRTRKKINQRHQSPRYYPSESSCACLVVRERMFMIVALDNAAVARVILLLARIGGFGCVVAGAAAAGTSALAVLLVIITATIAIPRNGRDASILSPAFDSFVAVLIQRCKVLPQVFVHGGHRVTFAHRGEPLREVS